MGIQTEQKGGKAEAQAPSTTPAAPIAACVIDRRSAPLDRAKAQQTLLIEKRAADRMIAIFDDANVTQTKADCAAQFPLPGFGRASCEQLTNAEVKSTAQEFYRAIKSETRRNAEALEKYLSSCSGPVDDQRVLIYTNARENLFRIFLLKATDIIKNFPDAHALVQGKLAPQDDSTPEKRADPQYVRPRLGITREQRHLEVEKIIQDTKQGDAIHKKLDVGLDELLSDNPPERVTLKKKQ